MNLQNMNQHNTRKKLEGVLGLNEIVKQMKRKRKFTFGRSTTR